MSPANHISLAEKMTSETGAANKYAPALSQSRGWRGSAKRREASRARPSLDDVASQLFSFFLFLGGIFTEAKAGGLDCQSLRTRYRLD